MILGDDGGASVTLDGGESWSSLYNQPTAELYHVTTDTREPYRIYAAQQDNTTIAFPSHSAGGPSSRWTRPRGRRGERLHRGPAR